MGIKQSLTWKQIYWMIVGSTVCKFCKYKIFKKKSVVCTSESMMKVPVSNSQLLIIFVCNITKS